MGNNNMEQRERRFVNSADLVFLVYFVKQFKNKRPGSTRCLSLALPKLFRFRN